MIKEDINRIKAIEIIDTAVKKFKESKVKVSSMSMFGQKRPAHSISDVNHPSVDIKNTPKKSP